MVAPRALLFLLSGDWKGISRLPEALLQAGFQVATLSPVGSFLSQTQYANRHVVMPANANVLQFLLGVILDAQPDIIIPGCEAAVEFLSAVELAFREAEHDAGIVYAITLIRRSLGGSDHYSVTTSKHSLLQKARDIGVLVPAQVPVFMLQDALLFASVHGYPVVLKTEYGYSGHGVRICRDADEVAAALDALTEGWRMRDETGTANLVQAPPNIAVQQFIAGTPAMQSISAMSGCVLEHITVIKEHCFPAHTGPSSVVRFIEHEGIGAAMTTLVAALQYSGFGSADFIIDTVSQQAYLLELNARPCPISHIGRLVDRDIARALCCHLKGESYIRENKANLPERVALFPQEWLRDAQSPWLTQIHHDVPWGDPGLLRALLQ